MTGPTRPHRRSPTGSHPGAQPGPTQEPNRVPPRSPTMTTLDELSALIAHHAELVGPSLVGVGEGFRGSGFVIGPGQVLTNAHNLRRGETTLTSTDGSRLPARLVGMDEERDLAVLAVETGPRPALPWSEGSLR